ncbi:MAG: hypothetical protein Q9226_004720, partial [Calogaya cf. arnoldii]
DSKAAPDSEETQWIAAVDASSPSTAAETFISFYESSQVVEGASVAVVVLAAPILFFPTRDWLEMLDIVIVPIDWEHLQGQHLIPKRQLWLDCGVHWTKRLTKDGAGPCPSIRHTKSVRELSEK